MAEQMMQDAAGKTIPAGYKQTEVGVIPEDWGVSLIGGIADVKTGPFGSALHEKDYVQDGTPIITVEHLGERGITCQNLPMVSDSDKARLRAYQLDKGDIVFSRVGSIDRNALVTSNESGWLFSGRLLRVKLKSKKINPIYISYQFHSAPFKKRVVEVAVGQTMPSLNTAILNGISVVLPNAYEEQTAIANVLSDSDALIGALEQLIAKKQAIKSATMQQLLTGRTRLPAFALRPDGTPKGYKPSELGDIPEDWEVESVYKLANNQKALFDDGDWIEAEHITDKGVRLIQTGNIGIGSFIEKDTKKYVYEKSFESLRCKELHVGDLLICRLAEPAGRACILPDIGESKVITSVDVTIFRPERHIANRDFLVQYFSSTEWFKSVQEQVGGTTHKRISRGALGRLLMPYPSLDEQTAIATILSDMDNELQALTQKLEKARALKQGMMQQLLTGKIRLPLAVGA